MSASYIPYAATGRFSKLVIDYLDQHTDLNEFYQHPPNESGIRNAILEKSKSYNNRSILVNRLKEQYHGLQTDSKITANIESLASSTTFTVCTAHQPNIFTGHLYFIYKIIHAIKLADRLNESMPEFHFVPVYYMGSEDADLEELGTFYMNGSHHQWHTPQKGAVGRMKVDVDLLTLIKEMEGSLLVQPFGQEAMECLKAAYQEGKTIEQATFHLVNKLFENYGLVIVLPDCVELKTTFKNSIKSELLEQVSFPLVQKTIEKLPVRYDIQVKGRGINLFYLRDDIRARIEYRDGYYFIKNTNLQFTRDEILMELESHPERFSPNVILRPLLQETILPNIAFIGGGGELAYWLELKSVFQYFNLPMPALFLRNSFLCLDESTAHKIKSVGLEVPTFFQPLPQIITFAIKKEHQTQEDISQEIDQLQFVFSSLNNRVSKVDVTLQEHVAALEKQLLDKMDRLSKKIWRAEKRKHEELIRYTEKIHNRLFPEGILQERIENFFSYYATYGPKFIELLYKHSNDTAASFCILPL